MAKEFVLKDFLRHTDPALLEQYCKQNNISYTSKKGEKIEEAIENFVSVWEDLDKKRQYQVELDFQTINDMTPQSGFLNLLTEAKCQNKSLPKKEVEEMGSHNGSFWFFLNQPKVFDKASVRYEIEDTLGWKEIQVIKKDINSVINKENELAIAVRNYFYTNELRGKNCTAECYKIDGRICYVVYPEDWAEFGVGYDTSGKLNKRQARKPVFKIYFLYDPNTGRLSTKAKGGWQKAKELQKIFSSTILEQELDTDKDRIFNLNKLRDFNFTFPTPPKDKVEFVKVKSLRFSYPDATGRRITLDIKSDNKDGLEAMREFVNDLQIPLAQLNITQAAIQIKFPSPSIRLKGSVTVHLTFPNSWDLGDKPLHRKVKEYLKNWGIDDGFSNTTTIE